MKREFKIFFVGLILLVGCTKLDLSNPNSITEETYWKSKNDVLQALAATYNFLQNLDQGGYYENNGWGLANDRADDFTSNNAFTNLPSSGSASLVWDACYTGIFRANQVIEKTPQIATISDSDKKELIAEAKFLRGLNYFHIVINFGDAPIRLTVPKSQSEYDLAKSPMDSVYAQIFSDFKAAAADLPKAYPSNWVGRATAGAALGYLSKAYLYQKKFAEAETVLQQLMNPPFTYALMSNYADNFDLQHENNKESVFEVQTQDVGGQETYGRGANENLGSRIPMPYMPLLVGGWSIQYTTNKILKEFEKEKTVNGDFDPRMVASLVWEGETGLFYQRPIADFFPNLYDTKCRLKKYLNGTQKGEDVGINGGTRSSSLNTRAMRFADILLMHAEVLAMLGRPQDAYNDVNRIRQRASLSDLPVGYNQDQMMTEIRHQRMIEFVFEGQRFYDLRRWGLLQQEISNSDKLGRQNFNVNKHSYLPIPQKELDNNPKMVQRPGW